MPDAKPPKKRRQSRKNLTHQKRPKHEKIFWDVNQILDERVTDSGQLQYLFDWEDYEGKSYPSTWEPAKEAPDIILRAWLERKAEQAGDLASVAGTTERTPSAIPSTEEHEESEDSQPPRPANYRNLQRTGSAVLTRERSVEVLNDTRPRKRTRHDREATSEEPVPSFTASSFSPASVAENYYSDSEVDPIVVELARPTGFDPADYDSVTNTQSTNQSSLPLAELEEEDRQITVFSQTSQKTIQDSQEPSGQTLSSYHSPSQLLLTHSLPADTESLVIPDSQEQSQVFSNFHDTASVRKVSNPSGQSVPESRANESDIPSRQLGPSEPQKEATTSQQSGSNFGSKSLGLPAAIDQSDSRSEAQEPSTAAPPSPGDRGDQEPPAFEQTTASNYPLATSVARQDTLVFLSQPVPPHITGTGSSSPATQTLTPSSAALPRTGHSLSAFRFPTPGSPRVSQAAQVLNRDFGSAQTFSQSHISQSSSVQPFPLLETTYHSPSGRPLSSQRTMSQRNGEGSTPSSGRLSVADFLKQKTAEIFDDLGLETSQTLSLGMPPTANEGASQPLHTTGLSIQSQPIGQATSWIPSMSIDGQSLGEGPPNTSRPSAREQLLASVDHHWDSENLSLEPPGADSQTIQPATVSPAEVIRQVDGAEAHVPLMPSLPSHGEPSGIYRGPVAPAAMTHEPNDLGLDALSPVHSDSTPTEHIVTLPFQASIRPLYQETMLEYKQAIYDFSDAFSEEVLIPPSEELVAKIDELLSRLHNICDYPPDIVGTVLEELTPTQQAKYSCDANPKFSFVYELLNGLERESEILILARSVELLRLLYHVTQALEINCICDAIGKSSTDHAGSAMRVTLALPDEELNALDFTVVVGFDHAFNGSPVAKQMAANSPSRRSPLMLVLVTTHSVEHISLYVPDDLEPLERRNMLIGAMVGSRKLVGDPDHGYLEPDKLAMIFSEYLNGHVETIAWDPVPISDEALDVYSNTQPQPQQPGSVVDQVNSRKRKLDEEDEEDAKRKRTVPLQKSGVGSDEPPLTDAVRKLLESCRSAKSTNSTREAALTVPLTVLEALAEKVAEQERQLAAADLDSAYKGVVSGLEKRVKEYERTNEKIYKAHRAALADRTKFDGERRQAEAALQANTALSEKDHEAAQSKIADLEATIQRLTSGPAGAEQPAAGPEAQLKESLHKIQILEKRVENARQEADYARTLYQDASAAASSVGSENQDLKKRNDDLQKKASENLVQIQRIHAEASTTEYVRYIKELKTQLKEKDAELERARDELRQLRNVRRETRQVSVPRSPRMGMMGTTSPRTARAYGGPSRGSSPAPVVDAAAAAVPGMQFLAQQAGTGRWNHLRD